jgi:dipeptidyl aminopeptidase/acylaminoacyl peptidase
MGIYRYVAGLTLAVGLMLNAGALAAQEADAPPPAAATSPETPPPLIPASQFAGRPAFWDAKLSPDGSMLSFLRYRGSEVSLVVSRLDTQEVVSALLVEPRQQLEWYRWVTDRKLLLSVSIAGEYFGSDVRYTRLMLVELDTKTISPLFRNTDAIEGDNVIHVAEDGSYILLAVQRSVYDYPAVVRQELTAGGKFDTVQAPREGVWNWVADDKGVVRLGTGWYFGRLRIFYRPDAASELKMIARIKEGDSADRYWDALQIIGGSDEGYVLSEDENGRVGLRRFNFARREVIETVFQHREWDLDSATLREGKPYAAYYTADRDEVHYFGEAERNQDAALRKALSKALGDGEVWVTSRSKDGSRMLVWAGNEADPGVLYLFDPVARRLEEISQFRPNLDFRALARPRPIRYTARDGTVIRGYLTLPRGREAKDLPLVIMPHGGPFGVRDKLEYNDEVQLLANRGYAVLQPNFRGSGGYGDAFYELGEGEVGRGMQDDIDDAMDWAVAEGIADPKRVCVVGGSYGGYAALWAVLRNPERYACAASWAGVTDWNRMLSYDRRYLTARAGKAWQARVRGEKNFDLDAVSPYRLAKQLSRPVLLAHGTKDTNVPLSQYNLFEKAARSAPVRPETLVIKDEGHSFSKPENAQAWFEALDAFLARHNPADPPRAVAGE